MLNRSIEITLIKYSLGTLFIKKQFVALDCILCRTTCDKAIKRFSILRLLYF